MCASPFPGEVVIGTSVVNFVHRNISSVESIFLGTKREGKGKTPKLAAGRCDACPSALISCSEVGFDDGHAWFVSSCLLRAPAVVGFCFPSFLRYFSFLLWRIRIVLLEGATARHF